MTKHIEEKVKIVEKVKDAKAVKGLKISLEATRKTI